MQQLFKPDAQLEARKADEIARLSRRHCERTLGEKRGAETVQTSLYDDVKPMEASGQVTLF